MLKVTLWKECVRNNRYRAFVEVVQIINISDQEAVSRGKGEFQDGKVSHPRQIDKNNLEN